MLSKILENMNIISSGSACGAIDVIVYEFDLECNFTIVRILIIDIERSAKWWCYISQV